MNETKGFDKWIGILLISVIAIVAIVFVVIISDTRLAKGTYGAGATDYYNCGDYWNGEETPQCECNCTYGSQTACENGTGYVCSYKATTACNFWKCWVPTSTPKPITKYYANFGGKTESCSPDGGGSTSCTVTVPNGKWSTSIYCPASLIVTGGGSVTISGDTTYYDCSAAEDPSNCTKTDRGSGCYLCGGSQGGRESYYNSDPDRGLCDSRRHCTRTGDSCQSSGTGTGTATPTTITYKVYYNGNGNTGETYDDNTQCNSYNNCGLDRYTDVSSVSGNVFQSGRIWEYGKTYKLIMNRFTKEGYTFVGWAKTANGEAVYEDYEEVSNLASTNGATVTLYAVWKKIESSSSSSSILNGACYLLDHKYYWRTAIPNDGTSAGTLISGKAKTECTGCENGYSLNRTTGKCSKDGGTTSTITPSSSTMEETNPQTGMSGIVIAWLIGLFAIGYSFWYFKRASSN